MWFVDWLLDGVTDASSTVDGLRRVIVSGKLMDDFLRVALPNTLKNIETCGILCGKLVSLVALLVQLFVC